MGRRNHFIVLAMAVLCGVIVLPLQGSGLTPPYSEEGAPENNPLQLWLPMTEGSGSTANDYANFHACSNPAYSEPNFVYNYATRGGTTGTPSWVSASSTDLPSLDYTRANKHFLVLRDELAACTTTSNAFDHTLGTDAELFVGAWIKSEQTLSCAKTPAGTKHYVFSKWDGENSDCSYELWLETVDTNGGSCDADSDLAWAVRAHFNDDSTNFSCSTPCEVSHPTVNLPDDSFNDWNHVALSLSPQPSGQESRAFISINGRAVVPVADRDECQDNTNIPEGVGIHNSDADLYIGHSFTFESEGFEGKIGEFMLFSGYDAEISYVWDTLFLDHMEGVSAGETGLFGGGGALRQYMLPRGDTNNNDAGRYGKGTTFDGNGDYLKSITGVLEGYDTVDDLDTLTVEAWIYPHIVNERQTIISQWRFREGVDAEPGCTDDVDDSSFRFALRTDGKLVFEVSDGTTEYQAIGTTVLTANEWYHVAAVITPATTDSLTADTINILVNGVSDTFLAIDFSSKTINPGRLPILVGATAVEPAASDECESVDDAVLFFDGIIDEVRINRWPTAGIKETYEGGVVINEVNFNQDEELIELYYPSTMKDQIDLDGWTLSVCSKPLKQFTFDGSTYDKLLDPGDIVTLRITDGVIPDLVDSSCDGAPTTCQWTTDTASVGTILVSGDIVDAGDGVALYRSGLPPTPLTGEARMVDAVLWTDDALCDPIAASHGRGHWQSNLPLSVGLVTGKSHSICLRKDGDNSQGVLSWDQCNDSIGSLNSTAATAIELLSFEAIELSSGAVNVTFQTGSELNSFGFYVLGSNHRNGVYIPKSELIMARGGASQGALYEFYDANPSAFYKLKEIEVSGLENLYGPFVMGDNNNIVPNNDLPTGSSQGANPDPVDADANSSMNPALPASGCGRIVASENRAPGFLTLFLVLAALASTRTHFIFRRGRN